MYNIELTVSRIIELTKLKGLSINQMLKSANLSSSAVDTMKQGKIPGIDKILAIAEFLDCSVDYLVGLTDNIKPYKINSVQSKINMENKLTLDEKNLLRLYQKSTDEGQDLIQEVVTEIWAENQRPKSKLSQYQNSKTEDEISSTKQLA